MLVPPEWRWSCETGLLVMVLRMAPCLRVCSPMEGDRRPPPLWLYRPVVIMRRQYRHTRRFRARYIQVRSTARTAVRTTDSRHVHQRIFPKGIIVQQIRQTLRHSLHLRLYRTRLDKP